MIYTAYAIIPSRDKYAADNAVIQQINIASNRKAAAN